jgi:hypothetical protein
MMARPSERGRNFLKFKSYPLETRSCGVLQVEAKSMAAPNTKTAIPRTMRSLIQTPVR